MKGILLILAVFAVIGGAYYYLIVADEGGDVSGDPATIETSTD